MNPHIASHMMSMGLLLRLSTRESSLESASTAMQSMREFGDFKLPSSVNLTVLVSFLVDSIDRESILDHNASWPVEVVLFATYKGFGSDHSQH